MPSYFGDTTLVPHCGWLAIAALLAGLAAGCGDIRPEPPPLLPPEPARVDRTPSAFSTAGWQVIDQLAAHHVLIVRVQTARQHEAMAIAHQIVAPVQDSYVEVLVYFYRPDNQIASRRVQWTRKDGYTELEIDGR